ncbi:MAG: hypothetical protein R3E64_08480 [Halioglobus sp.]
MKRLIFAIVVILVVAALTIWGNRLLGRTLDAELGPLLSKQLGLPVQLAPIDAQLLELTATSAKLIMGKPEDPAVVATDVEVTLSWADLLHGEIKLVHVRGTDLMLRPSRWPSSSDPLPQNYSFLDQWIPLTLKLQHGRYVSDGGDAYPVDELVWQRHLTGKATAQWNEDRAAGNVTLQANLKSLDALLQLLPIELEISLGVKGRPDSSISLSASIQPGTDAAYSLLADVQAADMTAHVVAGSHTAWQLPDRVDITIPKLETSRVKSLIASYSEPDEADLLADRLDATVPQLALPTLHGHVAVEELHIGDEISKDIAFDFVTGDQGLQISALSAQGPASVIQGNLGISSSPQGWNVKVDTSLQAREPKGAMATQFTGSDWLWRQGQVTLRGSGNTWGSLLNSLQGEIELNGHYQGKEQTPVAIEAQLDNRPGEFAFDNLKITLGDGRLSGSAVLSGSDQRTLSLNLHGEYLDLGFLFDTEDNKPLPGVAVPEYLTALPDLNLKLNVSVDGLKTPALSLGEASATLERTPLGGKLTATAKGVRTTVLST